MTPTRREFLKTAAGMMALPLIGDMEMADTIRLPASYYQQFDADFERDVPGEGYGGWKKSEIEISREHTAVVVMHAWDMGTREQFPGWHRAVEYIPRADKICRTVFPRLLKAVRDSKFRLFHVVGGGDYYDDLPGYKPGPPARPLEQIKADPVLERLHQFRAEHVFVGKHNEADVSAGFKRLTFPKEARPLGNEPVAENAEQLFAACKEAGVNHLIYAGFAINWCLLMSSGGMLDMSRQGIMCSAFRDAVTAVENKESARKELHKEEALWRVALQFGFVFGVDDFLRAIG
jgi:hypothetical protein